MPRLSLKKYKIVGDPGPIDSFLQARLENQLKDPCSNPEAAGHPQVIAHVRYRQAAIVDADIAPLLVHLWRNCIDTRYSCQGKPGSRRPRDRAYLMFFLASDVHLFVSCLDPKSEMAGFATGEILVKTKKRYQKRSRLVLHPDTWEWHLLVPRFDDGHMEVRYSVDFPAKHIPAILSALRPLSETHRERLQD